MTKMCRSFFYQNDEEYQSIVFPSLSFSAAVYFQRNLLGFKSSTSHVGKFLSFSPHSRPFNPLSLLSFSYIKTQDLPEQF